MPPVATKRFLDVEILGVQAVRRQLLRGAARAGNMRPALTEIREDIWRVIRLNFETEGARTGPPWKPISDKWLERKIAQGRGEAILVYRGRLYDAFTGRSRWTRSRITKDQIIMDSNLPYANVQNYGSDDQGIPARPFVRFLPQDRERWTKMATASLVAAMRGE